MSHGLTFSLAALLSLIPAPLSVVLRRKGRDPLYWILLAVAVWGPLVWSFVQLSGHWNASFSTALWVTVAASMLIFSVLSRVTEEGWRLTPLLLPYLFLLGVIATVWLHAPREPMAPTSRAWLDAHIVTSVFTYGLVTIAAVAALSAFLQERALKNKRPTALTRLLPSVADSEWLMVTLLGTGEAVLALGLATGMATQYFTTGSLLVLDHKIVFSIIAFVIIGGLLVAHRRTGLRGRVAARLVLFAYLLLTLGYPGVKFVTDVLLRR